MAPHGKELTTEQKEIIVNLSNEGFSSYKIQNMTGINSRTIQKFCLKRMRERGSIENLPRSGGRLKTTPRDDKFFYGVGTLTLVEGNMNTEKYISVLDDNLWPVIARHFSNRLCISQEDNAPCHDSVRANLWKEENNINTLPWPAQSPDLNIIENVWKMLNIQVQQRVSEIRNAQDLKRIVSDIWSSLPLHYVRSLYASLSR